MIRKFKNPVRWTYVVSDLHGKENVGTFFEKELQKTSQKKFRVEKMIKKTINYILKGKDKIILLTVGLIKKTDKNTFENRYI